MNLVDLLEDEKFSCPVCKIIKIKVLEMKLDCLFSCEEINSVLFAAAPEFYCKKCGYDEIVGFHDLDPKSVRVEYEREKLLETIKTEDDDFSKIGL